MIPRRYDDRGPQTFEEMLTENTVAEAGRAAGLPVPVQYLPVTGSTNTDLFAMAEQGAPEWTVVVAGSQEAGRGRLGRTWVSTSPGDSLLASVLLRPEIPPSDAPLLSLLAAVALVDACREASGLAVRCKWPNDLVVVERKVGGILAEAQVKGGRLEYVVIGTGVNVAQKPDDFPADLRGSATSVALEGGRPDVPALLGAYLSALRRRYPDGAVAAALRESVIPEYRTVCETIGRDVRGIVKGGRTVEGRSVGVGDQGQLIVRSASGGEEPLGFGEIEYLR
jgi:BirA family transcriptional regulator, biotin operon repressor / biotin---[acetyl-CoA-carboxylase] ligase